MKKIAAENGFPSASAIDDLIAETIGKKVAPEVVLAEIDDLLRSKPTAHEITNDSDSVLAWIGRFKSAIAAWNPPKAIFVTIEHNLASSATRDNDRAYREIMTRLHEARNSIRLNALCRHCTAQVWKGRTLTGDVPKIRDQRDCCATIDEG